LNRRILIVGFGNPLAGDDGAGPAVVARLRGADLPPWARVEDGGSDSLVLPSLHAGEQEIWLVDAIAGGSAPGSIVRLAHDEVLAIPQPHASAHELSLPESLRLLNVTEPRLAAVRYRLWGIEPESVAPLAPMCEAVRQAVEAVTREILRAIEGPSCLH